MTKTEPASPDSPVGLLAVVRQRAQNALQSGRLVPIDSRVEYLHDGRVVFLVRVAPQLKEKIRVATRDGQNRADPFLPYDRELWVADLSPSHVLLLNKFPVVPDHVLVVTREFQDQQAPLTEADFSALWRVLQSFPSIGFYNSGKVAGASQRHKHLQAVPLPLDRAGRTPPVPIESAWEQPALLSGRVARIAALPFEHRLYRFAPGETADMATATRRSAEVYREWVAAEAGDRIEQPYNLLITCDWMLYVPRCREDYDGISVNALGYAGALLVLDETGLNKLATAGPMRVLAELAGYRQTR